MYAAGDAAAAIIIIDEGVAAEAGAEAEVWAPINVDDVRGLGLPKGVPIGVIAWGG